MNKILSANYLLRSNRAAFANSISDPLLSARAKYREMASTSASVNFLGVAPLKEINCQFSITLLIQKLEKVSTYIMVYSIGYLSLCVSRNAFTPCT